MASLNWQKSSYSSEGNNCVELAATPEKTTRLRESDEPSINLTLRPASLTSLLKALHQGTLEGREA
ncbi:hypothetical protein GCM10010277_81090 [Streptomyces longisporoflavus]|uniref:DUF397 domain-containing protein n=1 Tax=Streptomyces longisporoflavus TaxID=28044 RepID=UPI00167DA1E3|nr:DUF397 domain-containing protein [Streptomyces longisporoflavus]GGV70290.1 hypothetical protein GCM10010277_81090 [Streptomyces longisporoflavus]